MNAWRYAAVRPDGRSIKGTIESLSAADAARMLSQRGLLPVSVEPAPRQTSGRGFDHRQAAEVLAGIAALTDAGVPLAQALHVMQRAARGRLQQPLERAEILVREGLPLSRALQRENVVPPAVIGIIEAGERGSGITQALAQGAAYLDAQAELRARVRSSLAYPTVLAASGLAGLGFITFVVLPRFGQLLQDLGVRAPLATRLLLEFSAFAREHALPLLTMITVLGAIIVAWLQSSRARLPLLRIPFVGRLMHGFATAQSARTLGMLLGAGVSAADAMALSAAASGDADVENRIGRARQRVIEGAAIADALAAESAWTPAGLQLAAIGDAGGRLPQLLERAAELERRRVERSLQLLLTLLEPVLILGFAIAVAFVAGGLLQAIYGLRPGQP